MYWLEKLWIGQINISITASLWRLEVFKWFQLHRGENTSRPAHDPHFIPGLYDQRCRQWTQGGITALWRTESNGEFDSFLDLCQSSEMIGWWRIFKGRSEIKGPNTENPSKMTQVFKDALKSWTEKAIFSEWYEGIASWNKTLPGLI